MKKFLVYGLIMLLALSSVIAFPMVSFGQKVTLEVWINDFNPDAKNWIDKELIPAFEKENPDIKINMSYIGWEHHSEKYLTAWAGGMVPDVFEPALEQAAEMVASGQALPLDKYIKSWGQLNDFFPVGYEPYRIGGKIYCLPFRLDTRTVVYRKDIFKEVGLNPNLPPSTWEMLESAAKKLNKIEGGKLVRAGFDPSEEPNWNTQVYMEFLWQNGGEALDKTQTKATFNGPEGVEALEFLTNIRKMVIPPGVATLAQSPIPYFATGQTPLLATGSWVLQQIEKYAPDHMKDVGVGLPLKKVKRVCNSFGGGFSISSKCKNPDAAWKFIEFFLRPENMREFCHLVGDTPARKSLTKEAPFNTPQWQKFIEASRYGKIYVVIPEWWMLCSKLGDAIIEVYRGKKAPKQALDDAAAIWNEVLGKKK